MLEPTLLLLDEPLGALDLKLREHMKIELKQLQAAFGTTFVYITHDQSEALVLSDRVGVMSHGRFEQLGSPQDLYYRPATPFVAGFVGANNRIIGRAATTRARLVEVTTEDGWTIHAHAILDPTGGSRRGIRAPGGRDSGARAAGPPPVRPRMRGEVQSLLFDGANSAVLLQSTNAPRISHRLAANRAILGSQGAGTRRLQLRPGARDVFQARPACRSE